MAGFASPCGTSPRWWTRWQSVTPYRHIYENYQRARNDKIVRVIVEAASKLRPVHISGAVGTGIININRRVLAQDGRPAAVGRNPEGFVDQEPPVIRIDDASGTPYAVIVNFPCHGTVLAYESKFVSPDWVGMLRTTVERAMPGAVCLFVQGADRQSRSDRRIHGRPERAHRLGTILGHEAVSAALRIDKVRREYQFEGFEESTAYQAKQP